jgi:uncharacterized protein YndB with AHSA1/START domain
MEASTENMIVISADVNAPIEKVWAYWTEPTDIMKWNQASDDWHTTKSENDLRPGGKFVSRMEAKDGSFGFDFGGTYDEVAPHSLIRYTLDDGRKVGTHFKGDNHQTNIVVHFEAEDTNPREMQHQGWQSILNSFKKYAEGEAV